MIDKIYCMSHYLAFRYIADENINFYKGLNHKVYKGHNEEEIFPVKSINDLNDVLKNKIESFYSSGNTAIFLSGGVDSAILASYLPRGTKAYTFKCSANKSSEEILRAKKYCDLLGLNHEVIEMHWSDFEDLTPEILKADGVPFHSIEVQLVKAARLAKSQGIEKIIIGDSSDFIYGGMDKLLLSDWSTDNFIKRYIYIDPSKVLTKCIDIKPAFKSYEKNGVIDVSKIMREDMTFESLSSYSNAFEIAGVQFLDPYSYTKMAEQLDMNRIRNGEPKYLIRELFAKRYPGLPIPDKIPMLRATDIWLKDYRVSRPEFISNCTDNMSGDQKWLCWCLEQFLNMHEPIKL